MNETTLTPSGPTFEPDSGPTPVPIQTPPRDFDWSPMAVALRSMAAEARVIGVDAVYGLGYVLAGFYIFPTKWNAPSHLTKAPFVMLCLVMCYLTSRVVGPASAPKTAMFYANLPRRRSTAYWASVATLLVYALAMDAVIGLGIWLRLGVEPSVRHQLVSPLMFVLPCLTISILAWGSYGWISRWLAWMAAIVILGGIVIFIWIFVGPSGSWERQASAGAFNASPLGRLDVAAGLAIAAWLWLWLGSILWRRAQIGERS